MNAAAFTLWAAFGSQCRVRDAVEDGGKRSGMPRTSGGVECGGEFYQEVVEGFEHGGLAPVEVGGAGFHPAVLAVVEVAGAGLEVLDGPGGDAAGPGKRLGIFI